MSKYYYIYIDKDLYVKYLFNEPTEEDLKNPEHKILRILAHLDIEEFDYSKQKWSDE